jgi:hypothetical protein
MNLFSPLVYSKTIVLHIMVQETAVRRAEGSTPRHGFMAHRVTGRLKVPVLTIKSLGAPCSDDVSTSATSTRGFKGGGGVMRVGLWGLA